MEDIYEGAAQGHDVADATASRIRGRFNGLLEARSFSWEWLTGPRGVVRGIRFTEITPGVLGIELDALAQGISSYLGACTIK